jgi:type I restriction enzyme M protein
VPSKTLSVDEQPKNDLPDVLARWSRRETSERKRSRTEQSFCVPKADLVAQGYDLSLNRYQEVAEDDVVHKPPLDLLADLAKLEQEIQAGLSQLDRLLR